MSEEDAFLDGIAADRADRTRLLVFADWLADRSDPREEFVRLHAKLLDMDGTEPEFADLEKQWTSWTASVVGPDCLPHAFGKLSERWLDAICRVCTTTEVETFAQDGRAPGAFRAVRSEYGPEAHRQEDTPPEDRAAALVLYHGYASDYDRPFEFVAETVLDDFPTDPFTERGAAALALCPPVTRASFWLLWRELSGALSEPPPLPELDADDLFLGAQFVNAYPDSDSWGIVAIYRDDYFALFWSTQEA
jgi:uncharacterized protein (TIGR02996 family)